MMEEIQATPLLTLVAQGKAMNALTFQGRTTKSEFSFNASGAGRCILIAAP